LAGQEGEAIVDIEETTYRTDGIAVAALQAAKTHREPSRS
jgi:hypothetical protein